MNTEEIYNEAFNDELEKIAVGSDGYVSDNGKLYHKSWSSDKHKGFKIDRNNPTNRTMYTKSNLIKPGTKEYASGMKGLSDEKKRNRISLADIQKKSKQKTEEKSKAKRNVGIASGVGLGVASVFAGRKAIKLLRKLRK